MTNKRFDVYRRFGQRTVAGWLEPEVLPIMEVLDAAQRAEGVAGAVAEIGVHHGRFFIGLSLLNRPGESSVAIDVFEDQELNVDDSGSGNLAQFRKNVERWSSPSSVVIHQGDSTKVDPAALQELAGGRIRLFSVDGGHTESIVLSDMKLAEATLTPGGIVVGDDVFNEWWPGVCTGTQRYLAEGGALVPFAVGFNKVFFALPDYAERYRETLRRTFDDRILIEIKTTPFAGHDVLAMGRVPRRPRDLARRSPAAKNLHDRLSRLRRG